MIGRRGERGSGISVLAARHDDDDYFILLFGVTEYPTHSLSLMWTDCINDYFYREHGITPGLPSEISSVPHYSLSVLLNLSNNKNNFLSFENMLTLPST